MLFENPNPKAPRMLFAFNVIIALVMALSTVGFGPSVAQAAQVQDVAQQTDLCANIPQPTPTGGRPSSAVTVRFVNLGAEDVTIELRPSPNASYRVFTLGQGETRDETVFVNERPWYGRSDMGLRRFAITRTTDRCIVFGNTSSSTTTAATATPAPTNPGQQTDLCANITQLEPRIAVTVRFVNYGPEDVSISLSLGDSRRTSRNFTLRQGETREETVNVVSANPWYAVSGSIARIGITPTTGRCIIFGRVPSTATDDPTATPEPTDTPQPTSTPEPTATAEPTATPEPTAAPEPTATLEPVDPTQQTDLCADIPVSDDPGWAIVRFVNYGPEEINLRLAGERNNMQSLTLRAGETREGTFVVFRVESWWSADDEVTLYRITPPTTPTCIEFGNAPGTATPEPTATLEPVDPTQQPTATLEPTATPQPTATLEPTSTPEPTVTSSDTATVTPEPTDDPTDIYFEPSSLNFVWAKGTSNPPSQSATAWNIDSYQWGSIERWMGIPSQAWLPNNAGIKFSVSVNPTGRNLDVGVYESEISLTSKGKTITLPVKLTVISADGTLQVNRQQLNFGGFLGDPIANQTVGLTYTGLNSTNWTASGPDWVTLSPTSGSVSATEPTDLTVGIDTAAISEVGQYTGTLTVSDGTTTNEITVELFLVAPDSPTVQLFGLEVTQGLQNLFNDMPFVANRPAFVRGHVRSLTGERLENVTAQLIGTQDGASLGTLTPINPGGSIDIVGNPDRLQLNESFLFELPASWRTGTVTLQLVGQSQPIACVDPAEQSADDGVADDCTVTLTYQNIPTLRIKYYLYSDRDNANFANGRTGSFVFSANVSHASGTSRELMAGLPLSGVDQQIHPTVLIYPGMRTGGTPSSNSTVLSNIRRLHQQDGSPLRHYYGLFARYLPANGSLTWVSNGPGGLAYAPGFTGMGEFDERRPWLLNAHEIGHNLGRQHVNCGNPERPDPGFPHPDSRISDALTGNEAYFGFNINTKVLYPPTHKDLMSYCSPKWISAYTYRAVIEQLKIHYSSSTPGRPLVPANSPILLVNGTITDTVGGSIDGVVRDTATAVIFAPNPSDYSVRLADANGQTIATYPVTPQLAETQYHEELIQYTAVLPFPNELASVTLLYQDQPIEERVASANAPTLTLTTPVGGESFGDQSFSITWDASDADGDPLTFNVDYSTDDGATWQKLAWDWPEMELEIDSTRLPGSTQARIRVSANDGFLTTFAESEAFTVTDQAPVATILSTNLNPYYVGGQTILLEGMGYDLEDGMLNDLIWHSDRDGILGTGSTLMLDADDLAEGPHIIRLEAKDSAGQSSFGDPTMGMVSEENSGTANDTVSFEILYDPLILPAELAVAPETLDFSTTAGSTQLLTDTLTISNLGDGDLAWTASSDSANVTLSSSSGDAPATVVVEIDATDLEEGQYQGKLTFTSNDDLLPPITIPYYIDVYTPSTQTSLEVVGTISTVAGNGVGEEYSGEGGSAIETSLKRPAGVAVDSGGNLYISDLSGARIFRVDPTTGIITTVAGNGTRGYSGDGGPANEASLFGPAGVTVDGSGSIYIADSNNHVIRRVDGTTGIITTVAGNGTKGYGIDGGPAIEAGLDLPADVAVDSSGNLYIADAGNNRIRRVDGTTGIITTVAGDGMSGYSGDGGPAIEASLSGPHGVAVDSSGNLYIADFRNNRIRRVDGTTGIITTVAGNGTDGYSGDDGPATEASLAGPYGVALDSSSNLYIADFRNNRIRRVDGTTGIITTAVGNGIGEYSGDSGPATEASLNLPQDVAVDSSGNVYIADLANLRIRKAEFAEVSVEEIEQPAEEEEIEEEAVGEEMLEEPMAGQADPAQCLEGLLILQSELPLAQEEPDLWLEIYTQLEQELLVGCEGLDADFAMLSEETGLIEREFQLQEELFGFDAWTVGSLASGLAYFNSVVSANCPDSDEFDCDNVVEGYLYYLEYAVEVMESLN